MRYTKDKIYPPYNQLNPLGHCQGRAEIKNENSLYPHSSDSSVTEQTEQHSFVADIVSVW
jgi:hypothetical protein